MTTLVTQRPRARLDLLEQFVYFGEQAGVELAERYLAAIDTTCQQLLKHPRGSRVLVKRVAVSQLDPRSVGAPRLLGGACDRV